MERFANNASSTLASGINDSVTSIEVVSATSFPTSGDFRILVEDELMLVTGVSGAVFTVTRPVEGTTNIAHAIGSAVTHILTAGAIQAVKTAKAVLGALNLDGWVD